jgi:hypothetical protein
MTSFSTVQAASAGNATDVFGKCQVRNIYDITFLSSHKSKVHPRIDYEGPEGEHIYRSTLPLTPALNGVGGQRHALAASPSG